MYCCMMPSVPLNKESLKLEEINQNDSGISPSYCSGDSRGSAQSPASSAEDCGISTRSPPPLLSIKDQKPLSLDLSAPKSPQPAVALSQSQINLIRSLTFAARSASAAANRDPSRDSPRSTHNESPQENSSRATPDRTLHGTSFEAASNGTSHGTSFEASRGTTFEGTSYSSSFGGGSAFGALSGGTPQGAPFGASNGGSASPVAFQVERAPLGSPRLNAHDSSRSMSPASSVDSESYQDREHPLQQLALVVKRNDMLMPAPPETAETNSSDKTLIHCPLCNYTTNSRSTFNAHLHAHEGQKCCYICELMTESVEELRQHYQNVHDVNVSADFLNHSSGGEEEQGITVPKLNSQGKVKKHRCKQCGIVCVTKLEFWEHCRGHIKQERLLTCPKCPFVTEYKHHLEYHLRNHFGSKPFKCTQCSYSCVNKSMLNSHLKSHSNVYQFRCNDCSYATKYCHSLKLHLRKYKHAPAMVLNPDGSPNPLPIVDVYGTRRGPKQRPKKHESPKKIQTTQYSNQTAFPNQTPPSSQMTYSSPAFPTQPKFLSTQTHFPPSQFLSVPPSVPTILTPNSYSPTRSTLSPAPLSPVQPRLASQTLSPSQRQSPNPPLSSPQTSPTQFPNPAFSSQPYSMFPANYGLYPPFYPLVPNFPLSSLPLLQLDIPALLEEAKRSTETLNKLKELLQSNNNNSQYISKAVAQQIIDEASCPSTPASDVNSAPLDLSKSSGNDGNTSASAGSNRRKGKAVKRVPVHSMYYDDSDGERSPVKFSAPGMLPGAQKIY
nr:PREDICTED: protein hunchback-like [Bemisia tabaci]